MENKTMESQKFAGDTKISGSLLSKYEQEITKKYVSKIPKYIETHHLTLTTILWSLLIIVFSYLAKGDINWLWLVSLMIFFQYITDLFDGAVGRFRKTGLIKWGYYMDHFLDYIFLCSIIIGYSFILPDHFKYLLLLILTIFGAFMVNSYLSFAATNEFKIYYLKLGPTEIRIMFILINTMLVVFGKTYLGATLPYILGLSLLGLVIVVYRTQKYIWKIDMSKKIK